MPVRSRRPCTDILQDQPSLPLRWTDRRRLHSSRLVALCTHHEADRYRTPGRLLPPFCSAILRRWRRTPVHGPSAYPLNAAPLVPSAALPSAATPPPHNKLITRPSKLLPQPLRLPHSSDTPFCYDFGGHACRLRCSSPPSTLQQPPPPRHPCSSPDFLLLMDFPSRQA